MRRGFTLLEIMLTLVILSTVLAVAAISGRNAPRQESEDRLKNNLRMTRDALEAMYQDVGRYPLLLSDLTRETAPAQGYDWEEWDVKTIDAATWAGPYLATVPTDPVANAPLVYTFEQGQGKVSAAASGSDSKGVPFSSY